MRTAYRCPICWEKVYADGCAFWCNKDKFWISSDHVFNIAWASTGAEQLKWSRK